MKNQHLSSVSLSVFSVYSSTDTLREIADKELNAVTCYVSDTEAMFYLLNKFPI